MVAFASIACLSGNNGSDNASPRPHHQPSNNPNGILAFEAAKTVSRLLSLYKSLSDQEILKLRKEILKTKGIVYLNSDDEGYLLKLACAEKIEDLDQIAMVVSRLGKKCSDFMLKSFDLVYADLKAGTTDLRKYEYGSSKTKTKIRKLKRFLSSTLALYGSMMQSSSPLETSEKKLISPVPFKNMKFPAIEWKITPAIEWKITPNLKHSSSFTNTNFWTQPFEKVVRLMSRIVCITYARISMVFGPYVPDLQTAHTTRQISVPTQSPSEYWVLEPKTDNKGSRTRLVRSKSRKNMVRFNSQKNIRASTSVDQTKPNHLFLEASPNTVGGSRLQILYANLIMMAEENLVRKTIKDDVRDEMYRMLPENLKTMVKMKIRRLKDCKVNNGGRQKMKEALKKIFVWLAPMAHNTLLWQRERRVEMSCIETRTPVLLLQTLHFSDREKTEAAIVEVLVGLSFMYTQEKRRLMAA